MADPVASGDQIQAVTPWYLDKALYLAVLTPVMVWLNQKFGLALDATSIIGLVLPVVVYIVSHKFKAATIAAAQVAAASAAAAPAAELGK
jgi:hypothetical protein